jgi:hypothetical protein
MISTRPGLREELQSAAGKRLSNLIKPDLRLLLLPTEHRLDELRHVIACEHIQIPTDDGSVVLKACVDSCGHQTDESQQRKDEERRETNSLVRMA